MSMKNREAVVRMSQYSVVAYECINAIGNSLELNKMLNEVVSTFVEKAGAIGGKYILTKPQIKSLVTIGKDFETPLLFTQKNEDFCIRTLQNGLNVLDIPIRDEHFLFLFQDRNDLEAIGDMFSSFRIKLINAIDACKSAEQLHKLNQSLKDQVLEEKNKNEENERLIINQSKHATMGEMMSMIAHQWRQPITIIGMITNNIIIDLKMDEFDLHRTIEDLNSIDRQVHYLSKTIDDFRDFFKPNKLPTRVTFNTIFEELNIILGKSFKSLLIELSFSGDLDTEINTYKNELLQVFLNILNNAKDAVIEKQISEPRITLNIEVRDDEVFILIADNAGGIPFEHIDKIFEPYFSTKNEKNGTGLGLYMSAIIVEKYLDGSIQVSSDRVGTTFRIKIKQVGGRNYVY